MYVQQRLDMLNALKQGLGQKSDIYGFLKNYPKFAENVVECGLRPRSPSLIIPHMIADIKLYIETIF